MEQLVAHEVHSGCHVLEEGTIGLTEVVHWQLARASGDEAVLGAATVAGEAPLTLLALLREAVTFGCTKSTLPRAVHHGGDAVLMDVAQTVFGEDEVVTGIEVAIVFQRRCVATSLCHAADTGLLVHPAGQCGVKELDKDFSHVLPHPLVEDAAGEMGVLGRGDRERGHRGGPVGRTDGQAR